MVGEAAPTPPIPPLEEHGGPADGPLKARQPVPAPASASVPAPQQPASSSVQDRVPSLDPLSVLGPARPLDTGVTNGEAAAQRQALEDDPLARRPRISSRVLAVLLGLLSIAAAFGVWYACVFTENGQSYDEMVWSSLPESMPSPVAAVMHVVAQSWLVMAVSALLAAAGLITAAVRRRWWLIGQIVVLAACCLACDALKPALPRPFIINTASPAANSAPSGHVLLAAASAAILLIAVPRAMRAIAALIAVVWPLTVGVSVMFGQWHRASDVAMSVLLVAGLTLITLAFTRTSGMDAPGQRTSSPSIQIVGSVLITAGVLGIGYAAYVIWQVLPGLNISASWAVSGSIASAVAAIASCMMLSAGSVLALRHLTAAPLSRLGLIGEPPAPPHRP